VALSSLHQLERGTTRSPKWHHNKGMQPHSRYPRRRRVTRPQTNSLPYRRRGPLLSQGEAAFYRVLRKAVAQRYHVAFKARLADLVTCSDAAWNRGYGHLIARQHVDFVLCDYRTTEVLVAIELDDKSHAKLARRRRDRFLDEALGAASIPLVRVTASARYEVEAIRAVIECAASSICYQREEQ
jgi:hypothetical protein